LGFRDQASDLSNHNMASLILAQSERWRRT
jgi:hypothetical protein